MSVEVCIVVWMCEVKMCVRKERDEMTHGLLVEVRREATRYFTQVLVSSPHYWQHQKVRFEVSGAFKARATARKALHPSAHGQTRKREIV